MSTQGPWPRASSRELQLPGAVCPPHPCTGLSTWRSPPRVDPALPASALLCHLRGCILINLSRPGASAVCLSLPRSPSLCLGGGGAEGPGPPLPRWPRRVQYGESSDPPSLTEACCWEWMRYGLVPQLQTWGPRLNPWGPAGGGIQAESAGVTRTHPADCAADPTAKTPAKHPAALPSEACRGGQAGGPDSWEGDSGTALVTISQPESPQR